MQQLSMMELLCPPPPPPVYVPRPKRDVVTRAYGEAAHVLSIDADAPDPVEVEIRGIPCLVVWDFGASIYTVQKPGSLFWSGTGYRSMTHGGETLEGVIAAVEKYIDAPVKDMGCGGKPERWWPGYVSQWRGSLRFELEHGKDRSKLWDQWGPEKQAEIWARRDAEKDAALARMWAEGINPNDVGPPSGFKGKWPTFERNDGTLTTLARSPARLPGPVQA